MELALIPIACDAMVFLTHREDTLDSLTMEQITAICTENAYTNWKEPGGPDAALIPCCRNTDSGSQAQMVEFFLQGKELHPDIRQETVSVSMASVLTDVQGAMATDPPAFALGYSIYCYYQAALQILLYPEDSLNLLKIEGIAPGGEAIADQTLSPVGIQLRSGPCRCRRGVPGPADGRLHALGCGAELCLERRMRAAP